jgi:hypothetical protein
MSVNVSRKKLILMVKTRIRYLTELKSPSKTCLRYRQDCVRIYLIILIQGELRNSMRRQDLLPPHKIMIPVLD